MLFVKLILTYTWYKRSTCQIDESQLQSSPTSGPETRCRLNGLQETNPAFQMPGTNSDGVIPRSRSVVIAIIFVPGSLTHVYRICVVFPGTGLFMRIYFSDANDKYFFNKISFDVGYDGEYLTRSFNGRPVGSCLSPWNASQLMINMLPTTRHSPELVGWCDRMRRICARRIMQCTLWPIIQMRCNPVMVI